LIGARVDLIVAGYFCVPALLLICPIPEPLFGSGLHLVVLLGYMVMAYIGVVFGGIAEYFYFEEYGAKFNQIAIEYMRPGKGEISGMLWHDYPVVRAVASVAGVAMALAYLSWMVLEWAGRHPAAWWELLIQTLLGAAWIVAGCRGLKHRPIGINFIEFTNSKIVNQLAANGYYQMIRIWYDEWHRGGKVGVLFGRHARDTAQATIRSIVSSPGTEFVQDGRNALDRVQVVPGLQSKPHVIVVLMESHAAAHIGCLGAEQGVTPYFDKAAEEGLLFTRMYANGDRTARGLESVLCSFPPLPGVSIIKRARSHGGIYSAPREFAARGYETKFFYGGDASFDNMGGFMLSNGFTNVFEQKDVENPVWTTNWGHSDENVYNKILEDLSGRTPEFPLFGFFLTISNHRPYTWPPGKIKPLYPEDRIKSTFQYADYAMGQFLEKAKKLPQWENTVFVFVADHGSAVHGRSLVPIERYHIPFLVLAPGRADLSPRRVDTIASQIDVLPTLLSMLGGTTRQMGFGRDVLSLPPDEGSALMHYYGSYAYVRRGKVLMMAPRQKAKMFTYDDGPASGGVGAQLQDGERDLHDEALSYLTVAEEVYMNGKYCYPTQ